MDTKYLQHDQIGFVMWASHSLVRHDDMAAMLQARMGGNILSAGFVVVSDDGVPYCLGGSCSLGLQAGQGDTAALAHQLGLGAVVLPKLKAAGVVR